MFRGDVYVTPELFLQFLKGAEFAPLVKFMIDSPVRVYPKT